MEIGNILKFFIIVIYIAGDAFTKFSDAWSVCVVMMRSTWYWTMVS
jgi:hypothetical protein